MSPGSVWGANFIFMLTITTIVIANYNQRPEGNLYDRHFEPINRTNKSSLNVSLIEAQINAQLPPLRMPRLRHHHVNHWDPYFENAEGQEINGSQHVALHIGATAMLDCRVAMLADKTVMWTRQGAEKPFLLTLGKDVHISDPRYNVNFRYPNNWRLTIAAVRRDDCGQYACQVNTHPPRALITNVTVLAPDIRIVDETNHELRDRYYKTESSIELSCIVNPSRPSLKVPHPIWSKNGKKPPDNVHINQMNRSQDETMSGLHIKSARKTDSGEYSCSIGEFDTAVVQIHVLNGEKQAAVHHDQWNSARQCSHWSHIQLLTVLTCSLFVYNAHSTMYLM